MTEKYNPWTVVNVVFKHLADEGLHPVLGEAGDPSAPAAELLRALGITPGEPAQGDGQVAQEIRDELAALRAVFEPVLESSEPGGGPSGPGRAAAPGSSTGTS